MAAAAACPPPLPPRPPTSPSTYSLAALAGEGSAVFVSNLQWWTTDAELEAACAPYGHVLNIRFIDDKACGKSRGMAIVEFAEGEAAAQCIAGLNGCVARLGVCVCGCRLGRRMGRAAGTADGCAAGALAWLAEFCAAAAAQHSTAQHSTAQQQLAIAHIV